MCTKKVYSRNLYKRFELYSRIRYPKTKLHRRILYQQTLGRRTRQQQKSGTEVPGTRNNRAKLQKTLYTNILYHPTYLFLTATEPGFGKAFGRPSTGLRQLRRKTAGLRQLQKLGVSLRQLRKCIQQFLEKVQSCTSLKLGPQYTL